MATRISPPQNKTYYINPAYLTFVENSGYGANLIQVSASSSCYISVYDPANGIGYSDADRNYQRWKVTAHNNKFPDDKPEHRSKWYIYVRLEQKGSSALIIYDQILRGVKGGEITVSKDENGNDVYTEAESTQDTYWFIKIGEVGATDGTSIREVIYDTGYLTSDQGAIDAGGLSDMWELDKYSTPWLIRAKQWLMNFTVKGFITLVGGLIFSKGSGESEKPVTDVATTEDKENEEVINDTTIATTAWVSEKFSEISDDKYLRKDQPDRTPYDLAVGGVFSAETSILFQEKQISGFIRYYDEPKPEIVTDVDFYSALMTDKRIEEEMRNLDDRYLRKDPSDIPDTAHRPIKFEEGITVYKMAEMMNLQVWELARIARAIVDVIGSEKFVDGFFGEGYQIWKSIATGDWCMTLDRLMVRKVMTVYELLIQKIRSVGGMIVVSAGNGKVKEVVKEGLEYKFTFEDTNTFAENDLMRCQVWTGVGIKAYWVEVTRVEGEHVFARIADFGDVIPEAGDEVVLMGNTKNKLRQNLLVLSATEDGQPRFDCLDGVHTKNFEGCIRARVGCLDGISDDQFPPGLQPQGYGLYADNCYLRGVFVLSTGVDVQTQFSILEGQILSNMSSVQQQINKEGNYLNNASFAGNLDKWEKDNDVRIFNTSGGLLHFNEAYYADKRSFAGIVVEDGRNVLRLKNSYIFQKNEDFYRHPEFSQREQTTVDEDGNEVGTGVLLYHPTVFYVSFRYKVRRRGTLRIFFEGEEKRADFEDYEPLNYVQVLDESAFFEVEDRRISAKWNGTGNFRLEFDGDIYIYDLALSDNALADMEERWSMQLEITDKKIQANAEHIIQQGKDIEAYRSEFLFTAEQLRTEFTTLIQNTEKDITEEYTGLVTQTAQKLESDYNAKIGDYYGTITEEYNSKITQTAKDITTELNAKIDATDKAVGDLEVGLKADYNAKIAASAESLTSDYEAQITNLKNGDIAIMKSSIQQNASQIATKVDQTSFNALNQTVSSHSSSITQLSDRISAVANSIETDASGNITNISKSGLVLDTEFASLFSEQMDENEVVVRSEIRSFVKKNADGTLESGVKITADVVDINNGVVAIDRDSATIGGFEVTNNSLTNLTAGTSSGASIYISNSSQTRFARLNGGEGTISSAEFRNDDGTAVSIQAYGSSNNYGLKILGNQDSKALHVTGSSYFVTRQNNAEFTYVSGLKLCTRTGSSLSATYDSLDPYFPSNTQVDCLFVTGNVSLPDASACRGKVYFLKRRGSGSITVPSLYLADGSYESSKTWSDDYSRILISDGIYWNEFYCR